MWRRSIVLRQARMAIPSLVSEATGEVTYKDNDNAVLLAGYCLKYNDVNTAHYRVN